MVTTLAKAIAEVASLPEAEQESIARELLAHVNKLKSLHADIADGLGSLESEGGSEIDIEEVIAKARSKRAGS
jgi:hypothetical protein